MTGCRWIDRRDVKAALKAGEGEAIYCSRPVATVGGSWCVEHRRIVYVKPTRAALALAGLSTGFAERKR